MKWCPLGFGKPFELILDVWSPIRGISEVNDELGIRQGNAKPVLVRVDRSCFGSQDRVVGCRKVRSGDVLMKTDSLAS